MQYEMNVPSYKKDTEEVRQTPMISITSMEFMANSL